ncbi:MAG: hypothetical protein WCJ21_12915 [Planctomycetota bacterium]
MKRPMRGEKFRRWGQGGPTLLKRSPASSPAPPRFAESSPRHAPVGHASVFTTALPCLSAGRWLFGQERIVVPSGQAGVTLLRLSRPPTIVMGNWSIP